MMHPKDAEGFEWDEANETELFSVEHPVFPHEVEEVFLNGPLWAPNKKDASGDWKMMGRTNAGRRLTIALSVNDRTRYLRAITGWDATTGEKTRYFERS